MKHSTIFRSRWFALVWAAGIIWFALDVAGSGQSADDDNAAALTDATGAPVDQKQAEDLQKAIDAL